MFSAPGMSRNGLTVVVSPPIALMKDRRLQTADSRRRGNLSTPPSRLARPGPGFAAYTNGNTVCFTLHPNG